MLASYTWWVKVPPLEGTKFQVPHGSITLLPLGPPPSEWQEPCLEPKAAEGGSWGSSQSEPSVCWLVTPTPGPQQNSKLVRSCLAVSGDV